MCVILSALTDIVGLLGVEDVLLVTSLRKALRHGALLGTELFLQFQVFDDVRQLLLLVIQLNTYQLQVLVAGATYPKTSADRS